MSRSLLPWLVAGGAAAAVVYVTTRGRGHEREPNEPSEPSEPRTQVRNGAARRNAELRYRSIGRSGEPYPTWVRHLVGKSGVYVIREVQPDGSSEIVYIGQSQSGKLYQTLTRHFQTWRRTKSDRFWAGQFTRVRSHDPGLTYRRDRVEVAVRVLRADRAVPEEARLIARLRPRDNLIGQPADQDARSDRDDVVPF